MTQNQNEAVNGQLWSECSKTKFCGARRVRIAACETIAVFNTGAASKAVTMELGQVSSGVNTMKALSQHDKLRIQSTSQKISKKYCKGKISIHKSSQNEMNMLISLKHLV